MFLIYFKVSDKKKSETEVRNFQENLENLCYNFISIFVFASFDFEGVVLCSFLISNM